MLKKLIGRSISDAVLAALNKSLAIIEFDPTGNILTANENFLAALGYEAREIAGQHHRMFIEEAHKRNLKVITELVINHTSDQHPWFQRARKAPAGSPEP